jgi:hypothetical protein
MSSVMCLRAEVFWLSDVRSALFCLKRGWFVSEEAGEVIYHVQQPGWGANLRVEGEGDDGRGVRAGIQSTYSSRA